MRSIPGLTVPVVMSRAEENKQLELTGEKSGDSRYSSRKFATSTSTSSAEKFRNIFYQQICDDDQLEQSRRTKLLGERDS